MFDPLFAWSWSGHGDLTTLGLAIAIARLAVSGDPALLRKMSELGRNARGFFPARWIQGESGIESGVLATQQKPVTTLEQDQAVLFAPLPAMVQAKDLHWGNIPHVGQWTDWSDDAQVRHFMRSKTSTSGATAYRQSRTYIRDHLNQAYTLMHGSVTEKTHWYSLGSPLEDFQKGMDELAAALHTMQDSYSPGHVEREEGLWWIKSIHTWDAENRDGDPSRAIPTHEQYDDPSNPKSLPFYQEAKRTTADLIFCVVSNLNQDQASFDSASGNLLESRLSVVMTSNF